MKRILVFLLVLFIILDVQGQRKKVGLVLSGWGCERRGTYRSVEGVGGSWDSD